MSVMPAASRNSARRSPRARRSFRLLAGLAAVIALLGLTAVPAYAAAITSATFSGGAGTTVVGGTLYAKSGAAVMLTVVTDDKARCVAVTGAHAGRIASGNSPFVFLFTTPTGSGAQSVTIIAGNGNNATGCNGDTATVTRSYALDNTGPVVTAALAPAPNGAGWNKSNVAITWTATDGGSGIASGPTPATDSVTANGTITKTATATDNLGNTATGSVTVRLDKDGPTVTGTRSPSPNLNGWNNTNVTVSWACTDTGGSGMTGSCPGPQTLTANAANQTATSGTVADLAGNTATGSVTGINIDKVAPTLFGAPSTPANAAGWYNGDVTIAWTATDALSGVTTPANSTITGEGTGRTASTSVSDRAGNPQSATSAPAVRVDRTAPNTAVTAPPAWNNNDVTLSLVANDGLSGIDRTFYTLDGGAQQIGTSVPVTAEGNHSLRFWSVDVAGNTEAAHVVTFGIDKTSPTIGHTQSPSANADGWNNTAVTVTFACSDALSGIATCTAPQTVATDGQNQTVTGTARDNAGNTATDPATVSIDTVAPVITVDAFNPPNGYGWYGDDVTVTYSCTDALSGVNACDPGHTFGEGASQTDTGTSTDTAGNSASATTAVVNVDKTAPTINGTIVTGPNSSGWFSGNVTVHWTCDDNLSGVISCPADSVVTGEGAALSASGTVTDRAGHTATATVGGIKIDRTKPSTTAINVPSNWQNAPVTVGLGASDNLSDIDSTHYAIDGGDSVEGNTVTIGAEGVHTVSYYSVDNAGNTEEPQSFTLRIDLSSPTITPSQSPERNANGWNNSDVTVSFACADQPTLSGLAICSGPQAVTAEGEAQHITGTATDNAGNSTSATATVNIDKTAPTITGAPDRAANPAGWYKDDVTVSFVGTDGLSGIASVSGPSHLSEGTDQSVTGTATDNAGNSQDASVSGINVDKTAPNLGVAPTTSPNANGWYNTNVTLNWACDDARSGITGPCPANTLFDSEGEEQVASASVSDVAGNDTGSTSEPVRIDKTAPSTNVSAPSGWVNSSVEVTLAPFDALSGVDATHYSVDGGARQTGTTVHLSAEGTYDVAYHSVDNAGNAEGERHVTVQIDKSDPTITHSQAPPTNANGWNNTDVVVTFTCDDQANLSGIASCTTAQTVNAEGSHLPVTGVATDNAGNTATDPATVSIDKTKPTISGSRTPAANTHGWNNTDVTVHFHAEDELSGLDSVTPDTSFDEGTNQSLEGTATDAAGNSASTTMSGINVDKTNPTLAGNPTVGPNANGWYKGDVGVNWTCDDERSGIANCPANSTITGEGSGLKDTATVLDKADNSTTADSTPVNIDRTAPTTGANAPAGWNNSSVTVSLNADDGLSGVDSTYYAVNEGAPQLGTALTINTEGIHTVSYWSVDRAGNAESPQTATVQIDLTNPGITHTVTPAPNAHGWNNTPVTVAYQCTDALSGVASCSPAVDVSTDGQDQAAPGTAVDNAGNTSTDNAKVSIDTVDPTISGAPDRPANSNNWYAGNVTVSFSCDDALSGISGCTPAVTLSEGAAQSANGTATDSAGNTASVTVSPISIDKTAPTLSGTPAPGPNAAGWYQGDVVIKWTANDALSGIDGAAPANSTIDSEGTGLTASTSVRDRAGNQTSATSAPVKIDRTAPSTTVSDVSDWSNTDVTVALTAADGLSGVAATYYQLDGDPVTSGNEISIASEGVHTLQVWSVDVAGNVEAAKNIEVKIDKTAPEISHTQAPAANARGWNNTHVTVTFTCVDGGSGIASCTAPRTVSTEGQNQAVLGEAVDNAGNSATDPAAVSIDKTEPTVTGTRSADANANAWFNFNVTVSYTCADQEGLSGVLSCPDSQTFGEGADQTASGSATDGADNVSAQATITGINVDKTDPTLSGAPTTAPNGASWYKGDVRVRWSAADALSGMDGDPPADSIADGEGADLSVGASVSDKAGNTVGASVDGIKIDRHDPMTTASSPTGWQNTTVTVNLTASDNLSGVAATYYTVDGGSPQAGTVIEVATQGTHNVSYWSVDKAGNSETAGTAAVLIDKTAPTITGQATMSPNANGWYMSAVTVHFTCADQAGLSGIATCQPDQTLAAQGTNSATGTAVDNAGNSASTTVGGLQVDTVKPTVNVGGVVDGASYVIGAAPAPTCSASDATSGLAAPCTGSRTGGMSNGVGTFTYTATAADKAGNVGTTSATYKVRYGYGATLFLQPVNDTAHQTGVSTSIFKAGQTVPMKFQLVNAAGQVIQAGTAPKWLTPVKGGSLSAAVNEAAYAASANSGSTYSANGNQYHYNWNTSANQAGYYWRVGVALDDGQTYYVNIGLR